MLRVGQSTPEGVTLVEATPLQAVLEINGQREVLSLSEHISGQYNKVEKQQVAISRNQANQYITSALIDGKRSLVLIDTGANTVAMSSDHARSLGIDYKKGRPGMVRTASGEAKAYAINLRSVDVIGLRVDGVPASVIEGSYPDTILLGMSYLEHVSMREQDGVLYLQSKY
jgi:aspartyl protease family protein